MRLNASADNPIRITAADADRAPCSASRIEALRILIDLFSMASGFIKVSRRLVTQGGAPWARGSATNRCHKRRLESGRECHRALVAWCGRVDRSKLDPSLVAALLLAPGGANNARRMSLAVRASRKSQAKLIHSWKAIRSGL